MRVLSVRNPQAALIMAGIKKVETRSFSTKIRGRIGIHCALQYNKVTPDMEPYLRELSDRPLEGPVFAPGYIIGIVTIVDCLPAGDWIEKMSKSLATFPDYEREWILGDLSTDRFAWILADPKPLDIPLPAKGRLGFWENSDLDFIFG